MARKKKTTPRKSSPPVSSKKKIGEPKSPGPLARWWYRLDEPDRRRVRVRAFWLALLAVSIAPALWGLSEMEHHVLADRRTTRDFRVELVSTPPWMPPEVVAQLRAAMTPQDAQFHDKDLARKVYTLARSNPWIQKVKPVRKELDSAGRQQGIVQVEAEFRAPFAVVVHLDSRGMERYSYVDDSGVVLPANQVPVAAFKVDGQRRYYTQHNRPRYQPDAQLVPYVRIYDASGAAADPGRTWPGEDLQDALRLAGLIMRLDWWQRYRWLIELGDYSQKRQLSFRAMDSAGREVYVDFGHFPRIKGDWKLSPEKKMENFRKIHDDLNGQLTSRREIDLRLPTPDVR